MVEHYKDRYLQPPLLTHFSICYYTKWSFNIFVCRLFITRDTYVAQHLQHIHIWTVNFGHTRLYRVFFMHLTGKSKKKTDRIIHRFNYRITSFGSLQSSKKKKKVSYCLWFITNILKLCYSRRNDNVASAYCTFQGLLIFKSLLLDEIIQQLIMFICAERESAYLFGKYTYYVK